MSIPSEKSPNVNAAITIMPTNFEALKQTFAAMQIDPKNKAFLNAETSSRAFQGSVSTSDAQTSVAVSFLTDQKLLEAMLPPGKNLAINGAPVVTVVAIYQGGIKWLAGRTYNLFMVMLPVVHNGKNGKTYGSFLPVVWENLTEPILLGREGLGWPKIYADLPRLRILNDSCQAIAHWQGFTFLDINVTGLHPLTPAELKQRTEAAKNSPPNSGPICHKFILKTGSMLETDADYLTISTNEGAATATIREVLTGKADIRFIKGTFEQLPTMAHIIDKLAALPVKQVFDATMTTQTGGGMGAVKILE
ncbi:MAG: acetoacetate decarboxylase family protein [Dehalococcoidales bacterium]|nr:acetoacetate decarboxylase family protein [Dehalococcoidales bacterium]